MTLLKITIKKKIKSGVVYYLKGTEKKRSICIPLNREYFFKISIENYIKIDSINAFNKSNNISFD